MREGFRLHDLRHTYASQAAMRNEQRFVVSRLLGHRRISSTHRYTHVADDRLLAAADRVSTVVATLLAGGVQLLEAKIERLETARPMARRRSR